MAAETLLAPWLLAPLLLVGARVWLARAARLPPLEPRAEPQAFGPPEASRLHRAFATAIAAMLGRSGVLPLPDAREALGVRIRLIRAAERSIDAQYYIWRPDLAGTILLGELLEAAERGVRVRLLLDDNGIDGLDGALKGLDSHPRIAVRLFNPFPFRRLKRLGYLVDFPRLNRRMHNKALIVDGTLAVVGGRNIGDEYFGATDGALFADLDAVVAGPAVAELAADFGRYWQCPSAHGLALLLRRQPAWTGARLRARASAARSRPEAAPYAALLEPGPAEDPLLDPARYDWVPATLVSDDPAKAEGRRIRRGRLADQLLRVIETPERELGLVSPYFVPTAAGVAELARLARSGIAVAILTNSFGANNHALVHAGYAPRRRALLEAGVRLFEVRPDATAPPSRSSFRLDRDRAGRWRGSGSGAARSRRSSLRASGAALHAKTFAVDRTRLFIGSFNFDPRSLALNTELGLVFTCPQLAGQLMAQFDRGFAGTAWELRLAGGRIVWHDPADPGAAPLRTEPGMGWRQRAGVAILSRLPIEWLL